MCGVPLKSDKGERYTLMFIQLKLTFVLLFFSLFSNMEKFVLDLYL